MSLATLAVVGITFVQAVTTSSDVFSAGQTRLIYSLGLEVWVVGMGAASAAVASYWLRYPSTQHMPSSQVLALSTCRAQPATVLCQPRPSAVLVARPNWPPAKNAAA